MQLSPLMWVLRVCIVILIGCSQNVFASEHCRGPLLVGGSGQNVAPPNLMQARFFPRSHDVPVDDPDLRRAMYKVFQGRNFYAAGTSAARAKIPMHLVHIDHVWPENRGGPSNIYNYALTVEAFNTSKGDQVDRVAINFWLSIIRNQFADKVYEEYWKLKSGATSGRRIPQATQEAVKTLLEGINGIDPRFVGTIRSSMFAKYTGRVADLERFTRAFVASVRRFPVRDRQQMKMGDFNRVILIMDRLEALERRYSNRHSVARHSGFVFRYFSHGKFIVDTLEAVLENSSRFSSVGNAIGYIASVDDVVQSSFQRSQGPVQSLARRAGIGAIRANDHSRILRELVKVSLRPTYFPPDQRITNGDKLGAMRVLASRFSPSDIVSAYELSMENRRAQRLRRLESAAQQVIRAAADNPRLSVARLSTLLLTSGVN